MYGSILNPEAFKNVSELKKSFNEADPYRHLLIKDFFTQDFLQSILKEFPVPDPEKMRNEFGGKSRKHAVHDIKNLGKAFTDWDKLISSKPFIDVMQDITGFDGLLYDPEYHGAGTHNNMDGQGMDVHIDFNLHRTTNFHRRVNLIIYINEEWNKEWGGCLELHKNPWDREKDYHKTFPPLQNHAVLFETNEISWHGFDHIKLPEAKKDLSRKSLTIYYYSKDRPAEEIARKHGTIYVQKAIPESVKLNEPVTPEAYQDLKDIFKRRDLYLKGLYSRESNLQVRIQGLLHKIKTLEEDKKKPTDVDDLLNRVKVFVEKSEKPSELDDLIKRVEKLEQKT